MPCTHGQRRHEERLRVGVPHTSMENDHFHRRLPGMISPFVLDDRIRGDAVIARDKGKGRKTRIAPLCALHRARLYRCHAYRDTSVPGAGLTKGCGCGVIQVIGNCPFEQISKRLSSLLTTSC